jgi:hypothetical protein
VEIDDPFFFDMDLMNPDDVAPRVSSESPPISPTRPRKNRSRKLKTHPRK